MINLPEHLGTNAASLTSASALAVLAVLLLVAVVHDLRERRIPNRLVAVGIAAGLLLQAALPPGAGFADAVVPGSLGVLAGLQGVACGLAALFPFYLLGATGAGDVKLMGMVGAFTGPGDALGAALSTLAAGAALGVAVALRERLFGAIAHNARVMLRGLAAGFRGAGVSLFDARRDTAAHLPYAVAILGGTAFWLSGSFLAGATR